MLIQPFRHTLYLKATSVASKIHNPGSSGTAGYLGIANYAQDAEGETEDPNYFVILFLVRNLGSVDEHLQRDGLNKSWSVRKR